MALDPAVASVRSAVRSALADIEVGRRVVVACSGGADSMALAAATVFTGRRAGWQVSALIVDHGLHSDSAATAATVAERLSSLAAFRGLAAADVVRVQVGKLGGPEAAARQARYAALRQAAQAHDAEVLLGHTRDDQAETVLLGLARGSGIRSLSGMAERVGPFRRPLLNVSRAQTARACASLGIPVWHDPDNEDPRFLRSRVRLRLLPMLEAELGPGAVEALARTAKLAAADADALDLLAADLLERARVRPEASADASISVEVATLTAAPPALRTRALRMAAVAAGSPAGELFAVHVTAIDDLVTRWRGQGPLELPGHVRAVRRDGRIEMWRTLPTGTDHAGDSRSTPARSAAWPPHPAH